MATPALQSKRLLGWVYALDLLLIYKRKQSIDYIISNLESTLNPEVSEFPSTVLEEGYKCRKNLKDPPAVAASNY